MREAENIRAVGRLDMDWMGFIFYPESPRYVPGEEAYTTAIDQCPKKKVGVFVNAGVEEILRKAALLHLDYVQLHGNESPGQCEALQAQGYSVIKAFSVATAADLERTAVYESHAGYFLFDTKCPGYGGSGQRFDWSALEAYQGNTPFLLSGGIRPESIRDVRRFRHPQMMGIDLNSGFEVAPAWKDAAALERFINELRIKIIDNESNYTAI